MNKKMVYDHRIDKVFPFFHVFKREQTFIEEIEENYYVALRLLSVSIPVIVFDKIISFFKRRI